MLVQAIGNDKAIGNMCIYIHIYISWAWAWAAHKAQTGKCGSSCRCVVGGPGQAHSIKAKCKKTRHIDKSSDWWHVKWWFHMCGMLFERNLTSVFPEDMHMQLNATSKNCFTEEPFFPFSSLSIHPKYDYAPLWTKETIQYSCHKSQFSLGEAQI